jgi:hypothetical protein
MGTIKALIESEVFYVGFTVSRGCRAAPLIMARPIGISLLIIIIRIAFNLFKGKCFGDIGGVYIHHLWLSNKPSLSNLAQSLVGKKIVLPS